MPHDLIIRNGTVIDGTGGPAMRADVAIDGDRITAIGQLGSETATQEIDAAGMVVTPGFVDLHTHLDAQVGWDPFFTSSSWHGVTTVLMGNCGVTFAPVRPDSRAYLAEMMESVEDIPREAILDGLPWDWETFPEYLDSVQRMQPALNVVGLVGHCAVRYHVMGERSMSETELPTPAELEAMRSIVAESVAGGAAGFSTSRILLHTVPDGRTVPGTHATIDEYLAIADGMNDGGGGLFQAVLDFQTKAAHEFELLRTAAERGGDVLFSSGVGNDRTERGSSVPGTMNRFLRDTNTSSGRVTTLAMTRPSGTLMGLHQVPPVLGPRWKQLIQLPTLEDRLAELRNPTARAELEAEGDRKGLWYDPMLVHPLGTDTAPDYHIEGGPSVGELAAAAGKNPVEWIIDRMLETEGREFYNVWFFNRNTEALGPYLDLDDVIPGLGDAGAHAGQICDADAMTHYLAYWIRERKLASLERAVQRLTSKPAKVLGLVDRGELAVGAFADVNVFDPERVQTRHPEYARDFPGGKGRLFVRADGYAATIVNGEVVTEQGAHTGARPGRVIREFSR
ncbi:MAG: D-aminoacylase [Ilumatobacteraceae bacterium]